MKLRASLMLAGVLLLQTPAVHAEDTHEVAEEAEQVAEHEGGHGHLSWHSLTKSLEFWGAVFNFVLLLVILQRLSKKPMQQFLSERREKIDQGIREAAVVKAKAEAVFTEYTERLKTLDQELNTLRTDIAKGAAADRARIVADAEESAKRVKAETEALVQRQAEQLEAEIRREVVQAAIEAAERAVRQAVSADDQRRLAETFAKELAKVSREKRV
ncbi:MAG TPA: ATP synthase F0 subunit B [Polyangiales bacterium]|nr:ATP synthase F0 subunit B [Polyangiales bacterium]